jgi:hypothetical protein
MHQLLVLGFVDNETRGKKLKSRISKTRFEVEQRVESATDTAAQVEPTIAA